VNTRTTRPPPGRSCREPKAARGARSGSALGDPPGKEPRAPQPAPLSLCHDDPGSPATHSPPSQAWRQARGLRAGDPSLRTTTGRSSHHTALAPLLSQMYELRRLNPVAPNVRATLIRSPLDRGPVLLLDVDRSDTVEADTGPLGRNFCARCRVLPPRPAEIDDGGCR
jgi:hypothetical protein